MLIDETRFFWSNLMTTISPFMDLFNRFRPLILLPFNVWFFFASLPFRFLYLLASNFKKDGSTIEQVKEKAIELKEEVIMPAFRPEPVRRKSFVQMEDRQPGWYPVDISSHSRRKSISKESHSGLKESKEEIKSMESQSVLK